jgi:hypothetical protein
MWPFNSKSERWRQARRARWDEERAEAKIAHGYARRNWILGVVTAVITALGIAISLVVASKGSDDHAARTPAEVASSNAAARRQPDLTPRPASPASPPVLVESVTQIQSESGDGSFALPDPLVMGTAALANFNGRIVTDSTSYSTWFRQHKGAAVNFGITAITLRGNANETVRLADLRVDKSCHRPLAGAFFVGYTQGSGNTVRMGFNLDTPNPDPQTMALTAARGLFPLGENYFAGRTIQLSPGEMMTLSIGAFTKLYDCTFKFRLFVATSHGELYETIDDNGRPFQVTAMAPPSSPGHPLSGYEAAYALAPHNSAPARWERIDPSTYRGS